MEKEEHQGGSFGYPIAREMGRGSVGQGPTGRLGDFEGRGEGLKSR